MQSCEQYVLIVLRYVQPLSGRPVHMCSVKLICLVMLDGIFVYGCGRRGYPAAGARRGRPARGASLSLSSSLCGETLPQSAKKAAYLPLPTFVATTFLSSSYLIRISIVNRDSMPVRTEHRARALTRSRSALLISSSEIRHFTRCARPRRNLARPTGAPPGCSY